MHTLYRDHHGWLLGFLRRRLGNSPDAADLAQDTFVRLLAAPEGTPEKRAGWQLDEPRAYLAVIAKRLLSNLYRRRSLEQAYLDALASLPEPTAPSEEQRLVILETLQEIDALLGGLPAKTRAAFLMAQLEGLGYGDIAARLAVSERTATRGKTSAGLEGSYTIGEGFARLLAESGLEALAGNGGVYVLRQAPSAATGGATTLPAIAVQGHAGTGELPPVYAGGQVASGARLGMLGNTDVMDTPFNQTSYTSGLIENQQAATLGDLLDNDPSVRRSSEASGSAEFFRVRGFNVDTSETAVNGLYGLAPTYGGFPVDFVQIEFFGRLLEGEADAIPGYGQAMVEITDPEVVRKSGRKFHPIVTATGNPADEVPGKVFWITPAEVAVADRYEVSDYKRELVRLQSGKEAWGYVRA